MGKITINHYLNKAIKPKMEGNKELYPLYIQVIVNRTNYRFKSNFPFNDGYLRDSDLKQDFVINSIEHEKRNIENIVNYFIESNKNQLITATYIKKCSENLWNVLNENFGVLFEKESQVLEYDYPSALVSRDFYDINEILIFTESEIDSKFSEEYQSCKIGVNSVYRGLLHPEFKELGLLELTVFDFLHGNGYNLVLKAIKQNYLISSSDSETEYKQVMKQIEKLIFLE